MTSQPLAQGSAPLSGNLGLQTLALALVVCIVGAQGLLLSPLLINLTLTFNINEAEAARAIAVYAGATALSAFFLARFIDVWGAGRVIRLSMVVMMLGFAMAGLAPRFYWLLAGQIIAGIASGVLLPAAYNLTTHIAPPERRAATTGRVLFGWSVAMVAGVPLAAVIADLASWRMAFGSLFFLAVLGLVASLILLPSSLGHQGMEPAPISLRALKVPRVGRTLALGFAFMLAFYTCYAFLGTYLRQKLNLSAGQASSFVLAYGACFGVASLISRLIDRWGEERILTPLLLTIAGLYAVMTLGIPSFWYGMALIGLWGFLNHFVLNMIVNILARANPKRLGETLGINSSLTYVASLVGAGVIGPLYVPFGYPLLSALGCLWLLLACAIWVTRVRGLTSTAVD